MLETVRNTVADDRVKIDVIEALDPLPISPWDDQTFGVHVFQRTILDTFPNVDSVVPGNSKHMTIVSSSASALLFSPPPPNIALFPFSVSFSTPAVNYWKQLFFPLLLSSLFMFSSFMLVFSAGSKKANRKPTGTMSLEFDSLHIQRNLFREERNCEGKVEGLLSLALLLLFSELAKPFLLFYIVPYDPSPFPCLQLLPISVLFVGLQFEAWTMVQV